MYIYIHMYTFLVINADTGTIAVVVLPVSDLDL